MSVNIHQKQTNHYLQYKSQTSYPKRMGIFFMRCFRMEDIRYIVTRDRL
jgi:hypothetical protein